jgi:predicted phosphodiesterase
MVDIQTFRDRKLSLWQSVVEERAAQLAAAASDKAKDAVRGAASLDVSALRQQPMASAATALAEALHKGVSVIQPPVTAQGVAAASAPATLWKCNKLALQIAWAKAQGDAHAIERLQSQWNFNQCDVAGWAQTVEQYLLYFQKDKGSIPYRSGGDYVLDFELPEQATIALIGDWGTGSPTARTLLEQVARKKPDVVFHLGDIYYSGTRFETQAHFLDICRQVLPDTVKLYSLSGNHDMYSGGAGYYWLVDQLQQQASYFCVRNAHWQFLAMDTGYNDFNPMTVASQMTWLTGEEADWHRGKMQDAGVRKTVLLSHHPLFSAYEAIGGEPVNHNLLETFQDLLPAVAVWFWGHEHRLDFYKPYLGLQRGRCLGCSAIPVFVEDGFFNPKPDWNVPVLDSAGKLGNDGAVYNLGYAIMQLDGPKASIAYYQDSDETNPLYTEAIPQLL